MRSPSYVCHRCLQSRRPLVTGRKIALVTSQSRSFSRAPLRRQVNTAAKKIVTPKVPARKDDKIFWASDVTIASANIDALVRKAQTLGDNVLNSLTVPSEDDVLGSLVLIKYAGLQLNSGSSVAETKARTASSSVASTVHEASDGGQLSQPLKSEDPQRITTRLLSMLAYKIIKHPPVFISTSLLEAYVQAQISLHKLDTIPEIFDLYAHKPVPTPNSSPITYTIPKPSRANLAIPQELANKALDLAIEQKKLPLALDIISSSFGTPAYRRQRFLRKAMPLVTGLSLSPLVALSLARTWAEQSVTLEAAKDAPLAALGIMTYIGVCSSLGWFALAGYNDHMERVSWIPGTPMRTRWVREDERAAADKVSMAWGFKEKSKRGFEGGQEWEWIKMWCGDRGMRLDAAELMEGME
jgi:hypothetical protein